jgi:type III restriction enzyme
MLDDMQCANDVISNYHTFKLRGPLDISEGGRSLLYGRSGPLKAEETKGRMIRRVTSNLSLCRQLNQTR